MSKKPTLKVGEFLPPVKVTYTDPEGHHSGLYNVSLGAEYTHQEPRHTRRYVRVNEQVMDVYAMVREQIRATDRKIERNEEVIMERALSLYVHDVLKPLREEAAALRSRRNRELAWKSPENWIVDANNRRASIEPIGIEIFFPYSTDKKDDRKYDAERAYKTLILERIVELVKAHKDFVFPNPSDPVEDSAWGVR